MKSVWNLVSLHLTEAATAITARDLAVSTFQSLGVRMLRADGEAVAQSHQEIF